jgi:hypothetical protein
MEIFAFKYVNRTVPVLANGPYGGGVQASCGVGDCALKMYAPAGFRVLFDDLLMKPPGG